MLVKCNLKISSFITIALFLFTFNAFGQDKWIVPDENAKKLSPFMFDDKSRTEGEQLFNTNCKSCHGEPGKANNQPMDPPAHDPASEIYQKNTDGEMYYKITEGRITMPSFKNSIDPNQRWAIISYIRSFNKNYEQKVEEENEASKLKGKLLVDINFNKTTHKINIDVSQKEEETVEPLSGYNVALFVKRYFGNMKIEDPKILNSKGMVSFDFPKNLPGDSIGKINLLVKISNEQQGFSASKDTVMQIGAPKQHVNILDQRAWWNVRSKAPLWLIISYSLTVLAVAVCILYIINIIYQIWVSGKKEDTL